MSDNRKYVVCNLNDRNCTNVIGKLMIIKLILISRDYDTVYWQREIAYLESENNMYVYRCLIILHVLYLPILVIIIMIIRLEQNMNFLS